MCYSLEVSVFFATVDFLLAYYLWRRNINADRWWAIFTLFPGFVQVGDLAMWYEHRYDPNYRSGSCSEFNQKWTAFQFYFTASQPIWSYLGSIYYRSQKLKVKWPVITVFDFVISLLVPAMVILPGVASQHSVDFNPCLTENPDIQYCSQLTEDGHWIWYWGKDKWGGGKCGRYDWDTIFGLPWTKDDPAFFAEENRSFDFPTFGKVLSGMMWTISWRWSEPKAIAIIQFITVVTASVLANMTTSYGNMWCFYANSVGFIGVLAPYILSMFGYDYYKVEQKTVGKKE